jgi:hypothetical protein
VSLIPIRVKSKYRALTQAQAVTGPCFGTCEDGLEYVLKSDSAAYPSVRSTEYVASAIAEIVGLPIPPSRVVEDTDRSWIFASLVFEHTTQTVATTSQFLHLLNGPKPSQEVIKQMSRIFAFDMFICNDDRHINNYIFRKQNNEWRVLAIDFSHSLFARWPLENNLVDPNSRTRETMKVVAAHWGFDVDEAKRCLFRIARIKRESVAAILRHMPKGWLPQTEQDALLNWWGGSGKKDWVRKIWTGLDNGSFL